MLNIEKKKLRRWIVIDSITNEIYGLTDYWFGKGLKDNFIKEWNSILIIEKILHINSGNIVKCCKEKYKQSGNYKWRYKNIL